LHLGPLSRMLRNDFGPEIYNPDRAVKSRITSSRFQVFIRIESRGLTSLREGFESSPSRVKPQRLRVQAILLGKTMRYAAAWNFARIIHSTRFHCRCDQRSARGLRGCSSASLPQQVTGYPQLVYWGAWIPTSTNLVTVLLLCER